MKKRKREADKNNEKHLLMEGDGGKERGREVNGGIGSWREEGRKGRGGGEGNMTGGGGERKKGGRWVKREREW